MNDGGYNAILDALKAESEGLPPISLDDILVKDDPALLEPGRWEIRTLKDAYEPRPPLLYLVAPLFTAQSLNIVYGAPGTLKSMLLADMCVCVAAGLPWLEPLPKAKGTPFATTKAPVLWLDFDNGPRRSDERFEALGKARNLPTDTPISYVSMGRPRLDGSDEVIMAKVTELVAHMGAKLIVIDNLGLVTGDTEENNSTMAAVMDRFRALAIDTDSAVIIIHHQRKANGTDGRKGDTLRGSSSIESSLDLALLIDREAGTENNFVTFTATKVRGTPTIPPCGAVFTYSHKEGSHELEHARFYQQVIEDTTSDSAIDSAILNIVSIGKPLLKKELTDAVKEDLPDIGLNRIRGRIDFLAGTNRILESSGDRHSKLYGAASR